MESAFGIDHGTISKGVAYGPGGLPRSRKLIALGRGARKGYEGARKAGRKVVTTEVSVQNVGQAAGAGTAAIGRGAGKVGASLEKHPGVTGAALIGGGAGYGGYRYHQARNKPPKTKKPKSAPEGMS
jgi:hypothetical protein